MHGTARRDCAAPVTARAERHNAQHATHAVRAGPIKIGMFSSGDSSPVFSGTTAPKLGPASLPPARSSSVVGAQSTAVDLHMRAFTYVARAEQTNEGG